MYRPKDPIIWEITKIKGSRFIAHAASVFSAKEAKDFLVATSKSSPNANHYCFAYKLKEGNFRISDAGEPRGSAGFPILQRIESNNLMATIVVVCRYFGGTKLGIGGLIRAYGQAASEVLKQSNLIEMIPVVSLSFAYDYVDSGAVLSVLAMYNPQKLDHKYGERIEMEVAIPIEFREVFCLQLRERTRGRIIQI